MEKIRPKTAWKIWSRTRRRFLTRFPRMARARQTGKTRAKTTARFRIRTLRESLTRSPKRARARQTAKTRAKTRVKTTVRFRIRTLRESLTRPPNKGRTSPMEKSRAITTVRVRRRLLIKMTGLLKRIKTIRKIQRIIPGKTRTAIPAKTRIKKRADRIPQMARPFRTLQKKALTAKKPIAAPERILPAKP